MRKKGDIFKQDGQKWTVAWETEQGLALEDDFEKCKVTDCNDCESYEFCDTRTELEEAENTRKSSRRNFLKLLGISTAGVFTFYGAKEGLKQTDTEIGKAIRFLDTYENIKSQQEGIDRAQQEFNADTTSVLKAPDAYANKLKDISEKIDSLTKEVQKINADRIRVNSGFVYQQQKKIQAVLARFNNENFRTVFTALGIYRGITGKASSVIDIVSSKVRNIVGGSLAGYAAQFVNEKAAEAKRMVTGNVTIYGVTIPIASLANFAVEAQKLSAALMKLQAEMEKLSDPNVEISNNEWIERFSTENPRQDFLKDFYETDELVTKHEKEGGKFDSTDVKKIQTMLVKYGYLIQIGKEDPVNGEYDKKTQDGIRKLRNIVKKAPEYRKTFAEHLEKGIEKPVIARGQDISDLQDLLGVSGYMSLKQIDGAYGWTTYNASVKCTKDWIEFYKDK